MPCLPPLLSAFFRVDRSRFPGLVAMGLFLANASLPGVVGGQEAGSETDGSLFLAAPYVGFHGQISPADRFEVLGIHLFYDLNPRFSLDVRAHTQLGHDFGTGAAGLDLLWRFRKSPGSQARAALGVAQWQEATALTLGLRLGGGLANPEMEDRASSGGIVPPILIWVELRGGVARKSPARGVFLQGVGIAEFTVVLLLRKAD